LSAADVTAIEPDLSSPRHDAWVALSACFQAGREFPQPGDHARIEFVVEPMGRVVAAMNRGGRVRDPKVSTCLDALARQLRFTPNPSGKWRYIERVVRPGTDRVSLIKLPWPRGYRFQRTDVDDVDPSSVIFPRASQPPHGSYLDDVREALRTTGRGWSACVEREGPRLREPGVDVVVRLRVVSGGRVSVAHVETNVTEAAAIERCLLRRVTSARLPDPSPATAVDLEWRFESASSN